MTTSPITADTDRPAPAAADPAWITATVRPAGTFGRREVGRLRALLDALSASASVVVLDLGAARLSSPRAVEVIDDAARRLEASGGCLLCLNADADARLALHPGHAVLLDAGRPAGVPGPLPGPLPVPMPVPVPVPAAG